MNIHILVYSSRLFPSVGNLGRSPWLLEWPKDVLLSTNWSKVSLCDLLLSKVISAKNSVLTHKLLNDRFRLNQGLPNWRGGRERERGRKERHRWGREGEGEREAQRELKQPSSSLSRGRGGEREREGERAWIALVIVIVKGEEIGRLTWLVRIEGIRVLKGKVWTKRSRKRHAKLEWTKQSKGANKVTGLGELDMLNWSLKTC